MRFSRRRRPRSIPEARRALPRQAQRGAGSMGDHHGRPGGDRSAGEGGVNKRDLSAFQDAAPEEEAPNPKVQRQKRAFVLNENGEPADGSCWSPIPDWVACRLNAAGAYGSTIALALAIARLV